MCYCNPAINRASCSPNCYFTAINRKPGDIVALTDPIAEKLDEIADMAEWWRKNRDKGRMPSGVRAGMLVLCEEIMALKQSGIGS